MPTVLRSIATGNPPLKRSQDYAAAFMKRVKSLPGPISNRIDTLYGRSSIDFRYSCIADYGVEPEDFEFFPKNWSLEPQPTTGQRNELYRKQVLPLAESVARDAIEQAGLQAEDITHVVAVSCTGFFAPGIDIELVKRLGLPASTQRTMIGFMGCYAAFNGMRVADSFCRSMPGANVLLVCAELCTLHFRVSDSMEHAVINSLFSDGAAAAVFSSEASDAVVGELEYVASHCQLDDDSMEYMTWDIGDHGFDMGLSARVPSVLARNLPGFISELTSTAGLGRDDIGFWAVHPGGRSIVDKAQEVLNLSESDLHNSTEVLRLHGNMSSPTILFVLARVLDQHRQSQKEGGRGFDAGVAVAFGPGLTLEGAAFRRVEA
ncbi:MAG: type III polyketide synthase [Rhodothermales bacterium]|nr:type III polyketide synthase [Rhodothermales bacterium]